ncbi:MAG: dehydrogenase [Caulobacteraceae bacterium]|nr:dehydrogenase [Caulobacteraceae bacterium]
MSIVIVSQMDDAFNDQLRAHPRRPTVVTASATPWFDALDADMFLVAPIPPWTPSPPRPEGWPGSLKWVCCASSGVDFYPDWLLDAPLITCARGVASEEIADYVIAAIYLQAKDLERFRARRPEDWKPASLGQVAGKTVGIVGLGAIGAAVARKALALGCVVTAARRRNLPSSVAGVRVLDEIAEVIASADHIVLALPSTEATRGLIGANLLGHAKPTAHLINIGRGAVLDHQALVSALDLGQLGFASLDVTDPEPLPADHPLWSHPRARLTPHISSNPHSVRQALLAKVSRDLELYLCGEAPSEIVDPGRGY